MTQTLPKTVGGCRSGACVDADRDNPCDLGCNMATGECLRPVELCEEVTCDMPPAAECDGNDRAVTYDPMGVCMIDGMTPTCDYNRQRTNCANGCELVDGVPTCMPGICNADSCDTAPAAMCDGETLVQFMAPGTCMEVNGMAECAFQRTFTNCLYIGGTCDAAGAQCQGAKTQSGEIIVTEFMADPELFDGTHEWIELYNTTSAPIDLNGYKILSQGASGVEEHTISASVVVPANGFALLANGSDPLDDGATAPAYQYADVTLFFVDFIEIVDTQGSTVDYVYWEGGSTLNARSRKLDPTAPLEATSNDDFSNLCPSLSDPYGMNMNQFGTPGAVNTPCAADPCAGFDCAANRPDPFCRDDDTLNGPTVMDAMCENTRFNNPFCDFQVMDQACGMTSTCVADACQDIPMNLPTPGDLIITELMGDPTGYDDNEWIEVYNTTGAELSLFTLTIEDNETGGSRSSFEVRDLAASIPANGYIVFSPNTDMGTNGGFQAVEISGGILKNTNVAADFKVSITLRDGTVIDEVPYAAPTEGVSAQLSGPLYLMGAMTPETANDDILSFCPGVTDYDATLGKGTPGADNDTCP